MQATGTIAQTVVRDNWSSRFAFLMAAIGSAVGLGNIWRFPYTAGQSGGSAFVLIYLLAILAIAIPVVMSELLIGRRGRCAPIASVAALARQSASSQNWRAIGWIGMLVVFLVLSFYSVIAGWAVAYVFKIAPGTFSGAAPETVSAEFGSLLADPGRMIAWHALFMLTTLIIVARGIAGGIERAVEFMMPALFVMLVLLLIYSAIEGDFAGAFNFLFAADFSKLGPGVVIDAIGQAFFSVGLASTILITYGAYLPQEVSIPRAAFIIALADTLVAVLAGMAIFPLVFAAGLDPAAGPGLIFVTLPNAFAHMPGGTVFGTVFFVLIVFAALTSSISIMEPLVSWLEDLGVRRAVGASVIGTACWLMGLITVFSFNVWSDVRPLGFIAVFAEKSPFDLIDYVTANILLPLNGMLIALFTGYAMAREYTMQELRFASGRPYQAWRMLVRYVVPVAIGAVLIWNFA